MNKILIATFLAASILFTSCGKKDPEPTTDITPTTEIVSKAQAEKVCAPFIKYLECSLEKAPPARKDIHEKILSDTLKKIEDESPDTIAQQCDTYIKILKENPDVAFKNGCALEEAPAPAPEVKK